MEEEKIVYREREVVQGEGTKERYLEGKIKKEEVSANEIAILKEMEEARRKGDIEKIQDSNYRIEAAPNAEIIQTERKIEEGKAAEIPALQETRSDGAQTEGLEGYVAGFKVIDKIGSGGFCDVLLVEEFHTNSRFAYKTLNKEAFARAIALNPEAPRSLLKLLKEETNLINRMSQIDNDHFPALAVYFDDEHSPGFLTEYIPHSLEERMEKGMPTKDALSYFLQIASTIKLLHEKGIVLGDVKPSNFKIDGKGNVKLVDLNLKYAGKEFADTSMLNSLALSLTADKDKIKGTPRYMAPEQWEGNADERTDVFQLSSLCYELLTGIKPEGDFENLDEIKPEFKGLDAVLREGMARDVAKRYSSVDELINLVQEVAESEGHGGGNKVSELKERTGKPIEPPKKQFDDLKRLYSFSGSDFKGVRKPWFMRWRGDSIDYRSFLAAGTNVRVRTTENILEAISRTLERQVIIKGIKSDLGKTLAFATIPFKNAPKTTPKEEDLYENRVTSGGDYKKSGPKYNTKFELIFNTGGERMGEIEYILPHNKRVYGSYGGFVGHRFTKGGIALTVLGDSIWNEEQYHNIQSELRNVRRR
ncbi:protein kinase [Candidatus Pacearchaeota archaeon]|nr:protein kinase [Candidatus Pacearchaeota archaeon]